MGGQRSTLEMVLGMDAVQSPTLDHPSWPAGLGNRIRMDGVVSFSISFNQTGKCSQYNCEKYRFHSIGGGGVKTGLFVFLLRSSDGFC